MLFLCLFNSEPAESVMIIRFHKKWIINFTHDQFGTDFTYKTELFMKELKAFDLNKSINDPNM